MAPADEISSDDHRQPMPGHGFHDLSHLCLAILAGAVAGVFGLALHLRRRAPQSHDLADSQPVRRTLARPPPPAAGRNLLTSLCVLRT